MVMVFNVNDFNFDYLNQPLSSRLPCYGMAIGRGYSVCSYGGGSRATYVKDGVFLDAWNDGKEVFGLLSLVTPTAITITTGRFSLPNKNFDAFEANILSIQLVLRGAGLVA